MFEIKSGVPSSAKQTKLYPFSDMTPGTFFAVPVGPDQNRRTVQTRVKAAACCYALKSQIPNSCFVTRQVWLASNQVEIRCYRV